MAGADKEKKPKKAEIRKSSSSAGEAKAGGKGEKDAAGRKKSKADPKGRRKSSAGKDSDAEGGKKEKGGKGDKDRRRSSSRRRSTSASDTDARGKKSRDSSADAEPVSSASGGQVASYQDMSIVREVGKALRDLHNRLIDIQLEAQKKALQQNAQLQQLQMQQGANGPQGPGSRRPSQTGGYSYREMQTVKIKVVFSRVMDIDTISQQFEAEVFIQARWEEKNFAGKTEQELEDVEFYECWDPQLKVLNAVGKLDSDSTTMVLRYEDDSKDPVLTYLWHIRGLFREKLELEHFPFDVQELSVALSSGRSMKEVELVPDPDHSSSMSPAAMQNNQEWTPFGHVEFSNDVSTVESMGTSKHSVLLAQGYASRRSGYYWWNIIILMMVILGMSMIVLAVDPTTTERLGLLVTIFLTCVAFKLVIKSSLPAISYLTYLDIYVIFTFVFLAMQAWEAAIMVHLSKFRSREKVIVYDEVAESILIAFLILFHAFFLVYIQCTAMARRRSISFNDHTRKISKMRQRRQLAQERGQV